MIAKSAEPEEEAANSSEVFKKPCGFIAGDGGLGAAWAPARSAPEAKYGGGKMEHSRRGRESCESRRHRNAVKSILGAVCGIIRVGPGPIHNPFHGQAVTD